VAKSRTAIELHLRPGLGHHRLDKLTVATVERYLNSRRAAGDSITKLEMIEVVLCSALSRATREELVARNVAQGKCPTNTQRTTSHPNTVQRHDWLGGLLHEYQQVA